MSTDGLYPVPDDLEFGQTIRSFVEGQRVFGRYVLQRIVGRGGMGLVWLAQDEQLQEEVALKFLPELVRLDEISLEELKRETRRSRKLAHHNIVKVYDLVSDPTSAAISMEFVSGATLSALRARQENLCFEAGQLAGWVRQLLNALTYAHEQARIVHRDLKPANVLVDDNGVVKVTDFGIAGSISESVSRVTVQRGASGTLVYMSPQQALGGAPSAQDDIYALGATLYELLTSKPPFYSGNVQHQLETVVPPPMAERRAALGIEGEPIPPEWEETVAVCLAKEPAQRPQSMVEVGWRLGLGEMGTGGTRRPAETKATQTAPRPAATATNQPKIRPPQIVPTPTIVMQPVVVGRPGSSPEPKKLQAAPVIFFGLLFAAVAALAWYFGIEKPEEGQMGNALLAGGVLSNPANDQKMTDAAAALAKVPTNAAPAPLPSPTPPTPAPVTPPPPTPAPRAVGPVAGQEWYNSLGMKFVPAGTDGVLFCTWDVRVQDFRAFIQAAGYQIPPGISVMKIKNNADGSRLLTWELDPNASWENPGFEQGPTHPVVGVGWNDAIAFCNWLTKKEQAEGKLGNNQMYRLPTDAEWSTAAGDGKYPWGDVWPPPDDAGNYADQAFAASMPGVGWNTTCLPENDGYPRTSPVGSFRPNAYGLYDMGGNVFQWCMDWYQASMNSDELRQKIPVLNNDGGGTSYKVLHGNAWSSAAPADFLVSASRFDADPNARSDYFGFRVVVVVSGQ